MVVALPTGTASIRAQDHHPIDIDDVDEYIPSQRSKSPTTPNKHRTGSTHGLPLAAAVPSSSFSLAFPCSGCGWPREGRCGARCPARVELGPATCSRRCSPLRCHPLLGRLARSAAAAGIVVAVVVRVDFETHPYSARPTDCCVSTCNLVGRCGLFQGCLLSLLS